MPKSTQEYIEEVHQFLSFLVASEHRNTSSMDLLKQHLAGPNRRFDALQHALEWHYITASPESDKSIQEFRAKCLEKLRSEIESSAISGDTSFLNDLTFFLEDPTRKYQRLKFWLLFMLCDLDSPNAPCQNCFVTTAQILERWNADYPDHEIDETHVGRAMRELGLKFKHSGRRRPSRIRPEK